MSITGNTMSESSVHMADKHGICTEPTKIAQLFKYIAHGFEAASVVKEAACWHTMVHDMGSHPIYTFYIL